MANKNAYQRITQYLNSLGLGELGGWAADKVQAGWSAGEVYSGLREQEAYKRRFAGNAARVKAGLPELSESAYLQQEAAYRSTLRAAGLDPKLYDNPNDFAKWMGNDVSPSELADRVKVAENAVNNWDPQTKKALKDFYGIGTKQLTQWALDPKRALPQLQKMAEIAEMGGAVKDAGMGKLGGKFIEELRDSGVDKDTLRNAAVSAKEKQASYEMMTSVEGGTLRQKDMVGAELGLNAKAAKKFKGMASREAARFSGSGASTGGTFSGGTGAGSF